MDGRIGNKFLHPGPGYGGSCFPKDTLAFVRIARECGAPSHIVEAVVEINEKRKVQMAQKIIVAMDGTVANKRIAVLGVAFKPNTDDVRDSASLTIIPALQQEGASIYAYDPEAMGEAEQLLPDVNWCQSAYAAMEGADVLVILTEWNEFRALDLKRVRQLLARPVIVDLRNIYEPRAMAAAGFKYVGVGRPVSEISTVGA